MAISSAASDDLVLTEPVVKVFPFVSMTAIAKKEKEPCTASASFRDGGTPDALKRACVIETKCGVRLRVYGRAGAWLGNAGVTRRIERRKANSPESNREQRQSAACTPCLDDSGFAREDDATSEYWDNFGIVEESLPGLSLETSVTTQPEEPIITGRRVVSLAHFVNAVRSLDDHSCPKLTGRFALVKERRVGLWSELTFTCSECQEIRKLTTDPVTEPTSLTDKANVGVNDAAVWAFMSIGSGHSQFEEAMAVMEIPAMSKGAFLRWEESLGKVNKLINIYFLFLKTMKDVLYF
ncbi:hypothetical protein HPB51_025468 [Rhipicephalus microplus]|uniref:Mutator-like transposase domain-containing protein n=1 Tax=Rhipicephalus microplus TaxID=6941 RepID=A0A9J6DQK8_RHIMP|nr:hypothetical protein HPB51_025468 [Rhipicephalus microplus]